MSKLLQVTDKVFSRCDTREPCPCKVPVVGLLAWMGRRVVLSYGVVTVGAVCCWDDLVFITVLLSRVRHGSCCFQEVSRRSAFSMAFI